MSIASKPPSDTAPARLQPLAKLPVFFDLAGRRAVVAGGTAAAAWKTELLAAAGTRVDVYVTSVDAEMAALVARGSETGRIHLHERSWDPEVFVEAQIAVADCDSEAEAERFFYAAVAAGVPVNVIDKPAFCQFQFGSIVNRSPVVVAISTDGAAPSLGQAIRRRIETLLPRTLADWAALAKDMRSSVAARLAPGRQRRAFWERFAEKTLEGRAPVVRSDMEKAIGAVANDIGATTGQVTLVGAGPGDPELLTLKAVRAMQSADVILFDELVSQDVLELARREAKRLLVGKRGGRESCRQDDINDLMVKLARQGKHVVRLKSGDPMIFGRAGEEIQLLRQEGIAVSVVPGITAASAMASALGASLTHRDHAHSVRFVTGHSRRGTLPHDLDWRGLADPGTTLVVYMGGRTARAFGERLIEEGLDGDTPVVIQQDVARPQARFRQLTLGELAGARCPAFTGAPTLIGIGRVFAAVRAAASEIPIPSVDVGGGWSATELVERQVGW